jgi:TPR repeat protein
LKFLPLILIGLATVAAAEQPSLSGTIIDARTLRIQEKVEALFAAEQYTRAQFIYLHELAPIGDKYAQYMLGFMYEHGVGVSTDLVEASAWYRLAAERGKREFVDVRDRSLQFLEDGDRARADLRYLELRETYSDAAVMFRQVEADYDMLMTAPTGTRIPGGDRAIVMISPDQQGVELNVQAAERRLERGLAYLATLLEEPRFDVEDYRQLDIEALQRSVEDYVARLD